MKKNPGGLRRLVRACLTGPALVAMAVVLIAGPAGAASEKRDPRTIRIVNQTTGPIQVMIDPYGRGTIAAGATGGLTDLTGVMAWIQFERHVKEAGKAHRPAPKVKVSVRAMMAQRAACHERVDYFTSYGMTIVARQPGGRNGPIRCEIKPGPRYSPHG